MPAPGQKMNLNRVGWSGQGILLEFVSSSNPALKQTVSLSPPEALATLATLQEAVGDHERRYGVSWSAYDSACGALTDRLTGLQEEHLGQAGRALYLMLRNLPLNGFERSFKMQDRVLLTQRFLLGIHGERLAPPQLHELLHRLALPQAFHRPFLDALSFTSFLHFGYEGAHDGDVYKLYQEYRQQAAGPGGEPVLLYTGYKWDPREPERRSVSQYRLHRALDLPAMQSRITALLPDRSDLTAVCTDLLQGAARHCNPAELVYVEVTEEGNPRRSCDINLYAADLKLADCLPVLRRAGAGFGIASATLEDHLHPLGDAALGHISLGTARDGQAFFTVYYCLSSP